MCFHGTNVILSQKLMEYYLFYNHMSLSENTKFWEVLHEVWIFFHIGNYVPIFATMDRDGIWCFKYLQWHVISLPKRDQESWNPVRKMGTTIPECMDKFWIFVLLNNVFFTYFLAIYKFTSIVYRNMSFWDILTLIPSKFQVFSKVFDFLKIFNFLSFLVFWWLYILYVNFLWWSW